MTNPASEDPQDDAWQECSPELIHGVIKKNHRETIVLGLKRVAVTSAALFCIVAASAFYWASQPPEREGVKFIIPVSCEEAEQGFSRFHNRQMSEAMNRRMNCHLSNCERCRKAYCRTFKLRSFKPLCEQGGINRVSQ